MRIYFLTLLAALLAHMGSGAQNLVQNGDFAGTTFAPWTASGFAGNAKIDSYDTNGTGPSTAYACDPGGQFGSPPFPPHVLQQGNLILVPILHELTFDLAAHLPPLSSSAATPTVEVFFDQTKVFSTTFARAKINTLRLRACVRYTPATPGNKVLRVEFSYPGLVRTGFTPRVYIDNISLRRATNPTFSIRGERRLGTAIEFTAEGSPSAAFVVFMALGKGPQSIAIPGILGSFELDLLTTIPLLNGALDASGTFSQKIPIPKVPGLGGVPLYWQALEVSSAGASFGLESMQAFYD